MKSLARYIVAILLFARADAALQLSVDDAVVPPGGQVVLWPGESLMVGVWSRDASATLMAMVVTEGPVQVDSSQLWLTALGLKPPSSELIRDISDDPLAVESLQRFGFEPVNVVYFELLDVVGPAEPIPDGPLAGGIALHWSEPGQITVTLLDPTQLGRPGGKPIIDRLQIESIPEPSGLVLLSLAALAARTAGFGARARRS